MQQQFKLQLSGGVGSVVFFILSMQGNKLLLSSTLTAMKQHSFL